MKRPLKPRGARAPLALAGRGMKELDEDEESATAVAALFMVDLWRCLVKLSRMRVLRERKKARKG